MIKILISEETDFSSQALTLLHTIGDVISGDLSHDELINTLSKVHILWVRLRHQIDVNVFEHAPLLRAIVSPTTGLNHIDLDEARRRNITVLSLQGEYDFLRDIRATAEHTITLTLSLLRHLPQAYEHTKQGYWKRDLFKGNELFGKTVGIIGFGRLGQIVSRYFKAFDANILVSDPNISPDQLPVGISHVALEDLLSHADIVTLHVNLTKENTGFFSWQQFSLMKDHAWFVNTSRGELVNEEALLANLQSGKLLGVALDVLSNETSGGMSQHPLIAYAQTNNNLLITPHIGGATYEAMAKTELFMAQKLVGWLEKNSIGTFCSF